MPAPAKQAVLAQAEPTSAAPTGEATIQIEIRHSALNLNVRWSIEAAEDSKGGLQKGGSVRARNLDESNPKLLKRFGLDLYPRVGNGEMLQQKR